MNPLLFIREKLFGRRLEKGPSSTIMRLCTSRHLADLQLVAFCSLIAFAVSGFSFVSTIHVYSAGSDATAGTTTSGHDSAGVALINAMAGAVLAAAAAALNWAYQTGSRRLGAVDLFACEISAICRVCLVVDFAKTSVNQYRDLAKEIASKAAQKHPEGGNGGSKFTSEEHYTPVYDNNLSDLQPLDVNVVTFVTEFYTYRKTMMDYLRLIAATPASDTRLKLLEQMIYMQFLMYESGREAVEVLVEFEPNKAESLINILCSEMVVYRLLLKEYPNDYKTKRLRLRIADYGKTVPKLLDEVAEYGQLPHWKKAHATARVLVGRYKRLRSDLPPGLLLPALTEVQKNPPWESLNKPP
jgi:hypothetical protein